MSPKLGASLPARIAVFDTETDGVDTETCHIVSAFVGVMDTATGAMLERWSWLLNTGHPIPQEASDVHGITTERMMAEGSDPKQGIFEIAQRLDIIARQGIVLVAMNAAFDFTLLDRELARHWPGMRPLMEPNDEGVITRPIVFDPMVLDRAIDKYRKGSRKLVDLARVYGVPVEANAHDAEADCRMAGRVAIKLMQHSRVADLSLSEVHAKLIPTHRNNALGLASYWERQLPSLPQAERAAKIAAIKEVREHAGQWPMRPRPTQEGLHE
jgi:DNA polymerase-3 subunit epsilon